MSSLTLTLTGDSSSLNAFYCPEIELDERYNYSCCLLDFYTYNSIPNVHEKNNKFYYSIDNGLISLITGRFDKINEVVILPVGSFELVDIIRILNEEFLTRKVDIHITADKNTMKCTIDTKAKIDFSRSDSIGSILGFSERLYDEGKYVSNRLVNIQHINNLRIECDLITGSYHNGIGTHTIYEFDPTAPPGYKINEQPKHLIYLPVVRRRISTINISILDQLGELIDFRGENITCRIHIKRDA